MIEKVKEMLAKQFRIEASSIDDDANIIEDIGADSLDVVDMLMTVETDFGVVIPDEDVTSLKTVRQVAEYIEAHAN